MYALFFVMPVCVECASPVSDIFKQFSKGSIRLTRCVLCWIMILGMQDYCKKIADKYVEYELVLIVIDLILHNPQVYRHILFNRIPFVKNWFDVCFFWCNVMMQTTLLQLTLFFLFFDSYLKWFIWTKLEVQDMPSAMNGFCFSSQSTSAILWTINGFFNCISQFF